MGSGMGSQAAMLLTEANQGAVRWNGQMGHPRRGDGSSQKTDLGHSAGYVSTYISPNLCPGLHFIRSTGGSSYGDVGLIFYFTRRHLSISSVDSREPESFLDSVRA